MTVQLIGITHNDSKIRQSIFVDWVQVGSAIERRFVFQGTGFGKTTHRDISLNEVIETLRAWRDLASEGMISNVCQDELTMRSVAGVRDFLSIEGEAR